MHAFFESMESRTLMSATISSTQIANLEKLASNLKAIHAAGGVTTGQLHQLGADVVVALKGANRPSSASVTKFRTDVKSALADKKITTAEKVELISDFQAILVSANVSQASAKAVAADIKEIITSSNFTKADANEILDDLKAIANTFKAKN